MAVTQIIEQLREEEQKLLERAAELEQQAKENTTELKRIQAAIAALGDKPAAKPARKPARATINKLDTIEAIEAELGQSSPAAAEELKDRVQARLSDGPKSMQGFSLRFAEALKDARFVDTPGGYRLQSEDVPVVGQT